MSKPYFYLSYNTFSFILGGYYFFYFMVVGVYIIFMPKFLNLFGYSTAEIGIIFAAGPFMRFVLPFLFQHWIALTHNVYFLSLLFSFVATLLLMVSVEYFWIYLFANLFFGAAMGISLPYVESIALERLSKKHYGKVRLWGSLGFIIITLWLGVRLDSLDETFYYLSLLTILMFFFGVGLMKYDRIKPIEQIANSTFSLRKYWAFWLSVFLMQVGFGGFYNFFTIYETAHGISLEMTTWMWSFGVICEIVMLYFQGRLLQRNLLALLQFATFVTALRWLLLHLYPESIVITFASQSLHAISFALYHTAAIAYVYALYTQKKLAQQFFLGIAFGLGGAVGAILSGELYGEYLFLFESGITLFAFIALYIHQIRKRRNPYV